MAKKKASPKADKVRDKGKTRLEIRFDDDVYERLKELADKAQVSVNQLLHGLARWASSNAILGDPIKEDNGFIRRQRRGQEQPGAIWWGKCGLSRILTGEERGEFEEAYRLHTGSMPSEEEYEPDDLDHKGEIFFHLDFTERRVVRDDV